MLDGVFIILFGLAFNFWFAFVAYALLQVVSNFGQAAYQALVPDFAPQESAASRRREAGDGGRRLGRRGRRRHFTTINFVWGAYVALIAFCCWAASPRSADSTSRRRKAWPSGPA
jgi:hypothetical protein